MVEDCTRALDGLGIDCSFTTSVEWEEYLDSNIQLFPNPANDYVNIFSDIDFSQVQIFNSLGELVFSSDGNHSNSEQINVGGLVDGCYFVKVESEGKAAIRRLLIQR